MENNNINDNNISEEEKKKLSQEVESFLLSNRPKPSYEICKKSIFLDCDEVLCNISPKWIKLIYDNREYFDKVLNLKESFNFYNKKDYYDVLMRKDYFIEDYIEFKDEFKDDEVTKRVVIDKIYDLYYDPMFYIDLKPTGYGSTISKACLHDSLIKKIYIVTKSTAYNFKSKKYFLEKLFKPVIGKLEIIDIKVDEDKSNFIKEFQQDLCLIAEDNLDNVIEIFNNCENISDCFIQIPALGYNLPTESLYNIQETHEVKISYYEPVQPELNAL